MRAVPRVLNNNFAAFHAFVDLAHEIVSRNRAKAS
jgi:hypothetical protein